MVIYLGLSGAPANRDEVMIFAREEESGLLKLEAEMRAVGESPLPSNGERKLDPPHMPHIPLADRLNFQNTLRHTTACTGS